MKFTNQFSNATPCQSDVAADAWEELCAYDDIVKERKGEIVSNCLECSDDWAIMVAELEQHCDIAFILDAVRDHSLGTEKANVSKALITEMEDIVEKDFDYFDRNISGESVET